MRHLRLCFIVPLFFGLSRSDQFCSEVTTNFGKFPPTVPYSYIIKYLEIKLPRKTLVTNEVQFDAANRRFVKTTFESGVKRTQVYDYKNHYYVGSDTYTTTANFDWAVDYCGMLSVVDEFDINDGKKFLYYGLNNFRDFHKNGVRAGIPAEAFNGCVDRGTYYKRKMNVTYYWTDQYITGFSASAPVRAEIRGNYDSADRLIYWFQRDPYFKDEDFQLPARIPCTGLFRGRIDDSSILSGSFSLTNEIVVQETLADNTFTQRVELLNEWYDYKRQISRTDYTPQDCTKGDGLIYCNKFMTSVHEFKTGLAYLSSSTSCTVLPLDKLTGDSDVTETRGVLRMIKEDKIFSRFDWDYKVKQMYRGMPVDIWTTRTRNYTFEGRLATVYVDMFFLDEEWRRNEMSGLANNVPLRLVKYIRYLDKKDPHTKTITHNIFNVDLNEPPLQYFTSYQCFLRMPYHQFRVAFHSDQLITEDLHTPYILNQVAEAIATRIHVSPLRVHVYDVYIYDNLYYVDFMFYEAQVLKNSNPDTKKIKLTSLNDATAYLKKAVEDEDLNFSVQFPNENSDHQSWTVSKSTFQQWPDMNDVGENAPRSGKRPGDTFYFQESRRLYNRF